MRRFARSVPGKVLAEYERFNGAVTALDRSSTHSGRCALPRAFTLLEALVVVFVMGVLTSLLVPSLTRAREAARRTVCVSHLKQVGAGVFTYAYDHNDNGPQVMQRAGTTAPRSLLSRSGRHVNLGLLLAGRAGFEASNLFCPSQTKFYYASNPKYIPQATVAGSYAYAVHVPASESPKLARVRHLALVSDDFVGRLGASSGIGKFTHRVGYNVLYTDGSATWYNDADESIWKRSVHWDDERDDINYNTLYGNTAPLGDGNYGDDLDIFRVWRAFCYNRPDPF